MVRFDKYIALRPAAIFGAKALLMALAGALLSSQIAWADPVGGGVCRDDVVLEGASEEYDVYLRGGETTLILVEGDGDTDLDLYVYGENGNLLASDTDASDRCVAFIRPDWTGRFTIRVVNYGDVFNRFRVCAL